MLIQTKKRGGRMGLAAVLIAGMLCLAGCGGASLAEDVPAPESEASSEAASDEASIETSSQLPPPLEKDPAAEALSEMRQLAARAAEYWGQLEKLVKTVADGGKQLDAVLERTEAALKQAGEANSYKAAEEAIQEATEGLAEGEKALSALEGSDELLAQADSLVKQLEALQHRAEELLENSDGAKKDSISLLKELIDKELQQAAEEKARLEHSIETRKSFNQRKAELSEEGERVLAEKKAEQQAAEQARAEEEAKAQVQSSKASQSSQASKAPDASADKDSSSGSKKVVVKKPQEDGKDKDSSAGKTSCTRLTKVEDYILKQMNDYRVSLGLPKLTRSEDLDDCAAVRVVEMLDNDVFSHTRPNGTSWKTVLTENGINPMAWGEIQYRQRGQDIIKADSAMASKSISAWKRSKGHDAVMRSKSYSKVGIAAYASGGTIWISDVVFID